MRRLALALAALTWLAFGLVPTVGAANPWTTITLVDQAEGGPGPVARLAAAAAAPAPDRVRPNGESPNYKLLARAVRWLPGPRVQYRITNAPVRPPQRALPRSQRTVDRPIT